MGVQKNCLSETVLHCDGSFEHPKRMLKFYSQKVCLSPSMNKYQTPISDPNKEFAFQLEYKNYYDMRKVNVLNSLLISFRAAIHNCLSE